MYARIGRARFRPEQSEEVIRVAQESLETFRRIDGFGGVTYLYDRTSGWGVAVQLWETQAAADAAPEKLRPVLDQFAPYFAEAAQSTPGSFDVIGPLPTFEVVAQA